MNGEVIVKADKIKRKKKLYKWARWILLILLFIIIGIYVISSIVYNGGFFTISLDKGFAMEQNLVLYEELKYKEPQVKLSAGKIDFMDNISVDWIPQNIDTEKDGPHNGDNYIAYTYYIENVGSDTVNYWSELYIDDVVLKVDTALRVMVIENGTDKTIYAKTNALTGLAEKNTTEFFSDEKIFVRERKDFNPSDIDKYTIVIWLEGDDPDCLDDLLGGEIKMHMVIRNEQLTEE